MAAGQIRSGRAYVELGVQDKLAAGLQRASAQLKNFAGGAAKLGAPLVAASAGILGTLGLPTKLAAEFEQAQIAFTTMLGDRAKAQKLMADIVQLSAATPFQQQELIDASKSLLAFGSAAEEIPDQLTRIGDISSGVGAPIGEVAEIFGKAKVAGTLFSEDINQLVGRGIPVIQEFAKQLGVGEGEVKKMASEGKVSFAMLEQAFVDLTSSGGKFAGMMKAQSASTAGQFSTMQDNISVALRQIGTELLPVANQAMAFGNQLISIFQSMIPSIVPLIPAIVGVATALGVVGGSLLTIAGGATAFSWILSALAPVAALAAGIGAIGVAVWALQDDLAPVFEWMADGWSFVAETATRAFGGISDALAAGDLGLAGEIALAGLKLVFAVGMESVAGIFGMSIDSMAESLTHLYHRLGTFVADLNNIRAESSQWLAEAMGALVGVEVTREDNALLTNASAWGDSWKNVDTGSLQAKIAEALDPEQYRKQLDELINRAAEAKTEVEAAQQQAGLEQPAARPAAAAVAGAKAEIEAAFASIGDFSAALIGRQMPGGKSVADKQLAVAEKQLKAQEQTNQKLDGLGGLAFGP